MFLHLLVAGLMWACNHFRHPPVYPHSPRETTPRFLHIHAHSAERDTVCAPPDSHALHPPCSRRCCLHPTCRLVRRCFFRYPTCRGRRIPSRAVLLRVPPDSFAQHPFPPSLDTSCHRVSPSFDCASLRCRVSALETPVMGAVTSHHSVRSPSAR